MKVMYDMKKLKRQIQLFLSVRHIEPMIWRRIVADDAITLITLHKAIQILMGWYDMHLHEFAINGESYAPPSEEDEFYDRKPKSTQKKLGKIFGNPGDSVTYLYDFGDGWEIDIKLETRNDITGIIPRVTCLGGDMSGPLEDSGGPYGYMDLLKTLQEPTHPEYETMTEWIPEDFDPETLDIGYVNEELSRL